MPSPIAPPDKKTPPPQQQIELRATYRLQFHRGFRLADAAALLPYLDQLGISHLYASPLLQARRGSPHGYDTTDPTRLNPELGAEAELARLAGDLQARGMGLLLDIVPNHMAATRENPWWWSVLERGPASPQARWFDIDWRARGSPPEAAGRVVRPVLGSSLTAALAHGEIQIEVAPDRSHGVARYFQHEFPLNPASLARLPAGGLPAGPELRPLLARQHYWLTHWRAAGREINYRRFFAINELVGFRVEVPDAFAAAHARIAAWLRDGWVRGLRVDHIDGLHDPAAYLEALRGLFPPGDPADIWVEKILASGERLPEAWCVNGTTGYDFLTALDRLQVGADGYAAVLRGYQRFLRRQPAFATVAYGKKRQAIRALFQGEMRGLGRRLAALAHAAGAGWDEATATRALAAIAACFPVYRTYARGLALAAADQDAVRRAVACAQARAARLPPEALAWAGLVLGADLAAGIPEERHADWIRFLMRWQQYTAPIMAKGQEDAALYVFVPLASLDEVGGDPGHPTLSPAEFHGWMAERRRRTPHTLNATSTHDTKRGEDVRARLNALAEIPSEWNGAVRRWSRWNRALRTMVHRRPAPGRNTEYLLYQTLVGAWPLDGAAAPEAEFVDRIRAYMLKAAREAAVETSWSRPNLAYEAALDAFIASILDPAGSAPFLASLRAFAEWLAPAGALNSLARTTLKVFAPGGPDFYQGCETWNFSLVDPDNRRPVEFGPLQRCLDAWALSPPDPVELFDHWRDGEVKLWLTQRLLLIRRDWAEAAIYGDYVPLQVAGTHAGRVLAFLRRGERASLMVVVPRLVAAATLGRAPRLNGFDWADTRIEATNTESSADAPARWTNLLLPGAIAAASGRGWELNTLLRAFPVAVLGASVE